MLSVNLLHSYVKSPFWNGKSSVNGPCSSICKCHSYVSLLDVFGCKNESTWMWTVKKDAHPSRHPLIDSQNLTSHFSIMVQTWMRVNALQNLHWNFHIISTVTAFVAGETARPRRVVWNTSSIRIFKCICKQIGFWWILYVWMAGQAKENLPGGSLKYLFVYLKVRIFKCSYRIVIHQVISYQY